MPIRQNKGPYRAKSLDAPAPAWPPRRHSAGFVPMARPSQRSGRAAVRMVAALSFLMLVVAWAGLLL